MLKTIKGVLHLLCFCILFCLGCRSKHVGISGLVIKTEQIISNGKIVKDTLWTDSCIKPAITFSIEKRNKKSYKNLSAYYIQNDDTLAKEVINLFKNDTVRKFSFDIYCSKLDTNKTNTFSFILSKSSLTKKILTTAYFTSPPPIPDSIELNSGDIKINSWPPHYKSSANGGKTDFTIYYTVEKKLNYPTKEISLTVQLKYRGSEIDNYQETLSITSNKGLVFKTKEFDLPSFKKGELEIQLTIKCSSKTICYENHKL